MFEEEEFESRPALLLSNEFSQHNHPTSQLLPQSADSKNDLLKVVSSQEPLHQEQADSTEKTAIVLPALSRNKDLSTADSAPADRLFADDQPLLLVAKDNTSRETKPYLLDDNLELSLKARQHIVRLSSTEPQHIPVMVNIRTEDFTEEQESNRSPIDLVCVIDISGSMCGKKLTLVKSTLVSLLSNLSEEDRLCLVQFDDRAERLTPLLRVNKANAKRLTGKINDLCARGGTNIAKGADIAFQVLQQRRQSNPVTSIFLLTDGLDDGAADRVAESIKSRELEGMNFTMDCFGFGKDHDEDLMVEISRLKNGSFYFIDKLDTVDECFAKALGGLLSVVAKNVSIQVLNASYPPFENIRIGRTFGGMWTQEGVTSGYRINLNYLLAGTEKGYVLELEVPPTNVKVEDTQRTHCVLEVEVLAQDATGTTIVRKSATLKLHLLREDQPMQEIEEDGEVMENYFRVQSAQVIEEAIKLSNNGLYEEGAQRLDTIISQINESKSVSSKRMEPIVKQLVESKSSCMPVTFESVGRKFLTSSAMGFLRQSSSITSDPLLYTNNVQAKLLTVMRSSKTESLPFPSNSEPLAKQQVQFNPSNEVAKPT